MSAIIVLDTGPLGLITNPKQSGENLACYEWLERLVANERRVIVPELADYEVRRELLRAGKVRGLRRLDVVVSTLEYLAISTVAMRLAASFWAQARSQGFQTAANEALDGDVILAAQAVSHAEANVIVATTNVGHLSRFVNASHWREIDT